MAFHPYPRVIPSVFNRSGFGPPRGLTPASACPRVAHPASRLTACDSLALLKTRFRCGSLLSLTSPHTVARWLILQKARRHTAMGAPTAWGREVSGAVSLPSRGAFHLSLAVLVRYRSRESVQPWRAVPPASRRVSRARRYSGTRVGWPPAFGYGALTLFRRPSQAVPLRGRFVTAGGGCGPLAARPATPPRKRPHALTRAAVWAGPVSLAATPGISVDFSSSGYLDVSVPPVASWPPILFGGRYESMTSRGFPHSGICGSKAVCASPQLIAACRALRRLPAPRHPPRARCIFSSVRCFLC